MKRYPPRVLVVKVVKLRNTTENRNEKSNPGFRNPSVAPGVVARVDDVIPPHCDLFIQTLDLLVQYGNVIHSLFDRSRASAFPLPASDLINELLALTKLRVNGRTSGTLLGNIDGLVDEFDATRFTDAVFLVAMTLEIGPFPVRAEVSLLVVKAHTDLYLH